MSHRRVHNAGRRRLLGAILCAAPIVSGCQGLLKAIRPNESQAATIKGSAELDKAMQDYQSGDLQRALDATQRARDSDPMLASAYELEAMLQSDLGHPAEHIATLKQLAASNPQDPQVQNTAGKLLLIAGQRDEGLAAMQRAVQLAPRQTEYARDLAGVSLQSGDLTTAAAILSAAQIQNPDDRSLPIALARLYETAGDWQRAQDHYRMVLQHDPQNAVWRRQHAKCAYRLQKFALAVADYQRCQELDISVLTAADRIEFGDACLRTGDLERAKLLFEQLAAEGCDTRELTILRGVCALRSDNPALAEQIFTQAVDRWPGDPSLELLLNNSRQARSPIVPAAAITPAAAEMEWMPPIPSAQR